MTDNRGKYEKLFLQLQKQYSDRLHKSHNLLSQYQQLTQQHGSLSNKKNTLIDVLEQIDEMNSALQNGQAQNGHTQTPKVTVMSEEREKEALNNIIKLEPELKERLQRILDENYDDDRTLTNLTEWAGILEHSDEPVGTWLKKFLATWKANEAKRAGEVLTSEQAAKKRRLDSGAMPAM